MAWKKEPWGRWSRTVALEFIMAAPQAADMPTARMASAKEAEASVAPAVVDAVAADINAPDTGAIIISLSPKEF